MVITSIRVHALPFAVWNIKLGIFRQLFSEIITNNTCITCPNCIINPAVTSASELFDCLSLDSDATIEYLDDIISTINNVKTQYHIYTQTEINSLIQTWIDDLQLFINCLQEDVQVSEYCQRCQYELPLYNIVSLINTEDFDLLLDVIDEMERYINNTLIS